MTKYEGNAVEVNTRCSTQGITSTVKLYVGEKNKVPHVETSFVWFSRRDKKTYLGVAEHGGDVEASGAFHVHEEAEKRT